jgi:hypothetical protein
VSTEIAARVRFVGGACNAAGESGDASKASCTRGELPTLAKLDRTRIDADQKGHADDRTMFIPPPRPSP